MYYIGIDWTDMKHDICILDSEGQIIREFEISNDQRGFGILRKRMFRLKGEFAINIERPDGLLVDWLVRNGHTIYVTPPTSLHHRRPRRSKDDKGDAYLLAYLLRLKDNECRLLASRSDLVEELRQLLRAYDDMVREQRRQGNRLTYLLKQYYPSALQLFSRPYCLIALAFLEKYPTPQVAKTANVDDLCQFLRDNHYSGKKVDDKAVEMFNLIQAPALTATVQTGLMIHVQILIPLLRHIYHNRTDLRKRIVKAAPNHPDMGWWNTIPGVQKLTGARLLAWIGDDRGRFPNANTLQATAGTAPVTRRSGKSKSVEFRHACSHKLRKAIDDLARQSVKKSHWAREYYSEQVARGHGSARSYRALGNRWLSIIWKLWQTKTPYDEQIHLANRARNKSRAALQRAG
jgi:transposase